MIIETFSSGPADTNSYLLACSKTGQAVVIDVPFESAEHTVERVQVLSLHLQKILLTHSHWDHTADAALLQRELNVPIFVHAADAGNVKVPGSDKLPLYFPITPAQPEGFLTDGQKIEVRELEIEVIHTPGHTPGGVCFYLKKQHVLFSGDTLFKGTIGNLSFPTGDPAAMWESLKRLSLLPKETVVYPGHGDPTTIGKEAWIAHAEDKF
jgi:glyoxylase-like metal-dependent hydrolase (beta-lactamase superfamily II)